MITTELNKTLANLGNNANEKTATNVETATSKVAKETKKKVEIGCMYLITVKVLI